MSEEQLENPAPVEENPAPVETNILNDDTPAPEVPQTWHDNWRQDMAGGDEKELKRLERMKSPTDVYKSYRELEKMKSSFTPPPKAPGEDGTDEDWAAYRESIGVPADPTGYDLNFDDGTAIGDDVMPHVEGYLKYAHENNMTPDQVKSNLKFFMDDIVQEQERLSVANQEAKINGKAELKAEWGAEYQSNLNSIQSLFTDAPEGVMESLMGAAGSDGLKITNNPDTIRWMVGLANQINPTASLLPAGANDEAGINAELEKLTAMMNSSDPVEKNKYWKDEKMQARFLQLTQAKNR